MDKIDIITKATGINLLQAIDMKKSLCRRIIMTEYSKVYKAFLARILEDEWGDWDVSDVEEDWQELLDMAIARFKFPRVSLEKNSRGFRRRFKNSRNSNSCIFYEM